MSAPAESIQIAVPKAGEITEVIFDQGAANHERDADRLMAFLKAQDAVYHGVYGSSTLGGNRSYSIFDYVQPGMVINVFAGEQLTGRNPITRITGLPRRVDELAEVIRTSLDVKDSSESFVAPDETIIEYMRRVLRGGSEPESTNHEMKELMLAQERQTHNAVCELLEGKSTYYGDQSQCEYYSRRPVFFADHLVTRPWRRMDYLLGEVLIQQTMHDASGADYFAMHATTRVVGPYARVVDLTTSIHQALEIVPVHCVSVGPRPD